MNAADTFQVISILGDIRDSLSTLTKNIEEIRTQQSIDIKNLKEDVLNINLTISKLHPTKNMFMSRVQGYNGR